MLWQRVKNQIFRHLLPLNVKIILLLINAKKYFINSKMLKIQAPMNWMLRCLQDRNSSKLEPWQIALLKDANKNNAAQFIKLESSCCKSM